MTHPDTTPGDPIDPALGDAIRGRLGWFAPSGVQAKLLAASLHGHELTYPRLFATLARMPDVLAGPRPDRDGYVVALTAPTRLPARNLITTDIEAACVRALHQKAPTTITSARDLHVLAEIAPHATALAGAAGHLARPAAQVLDGVGAYHHYNRDLPAAETALVAALAHHTTAGGPHSRPAADTLRALADVHLDAGNTTTALTALQAATAAYETACGPRSPEVAETALTVAGVYATGGRPDLARELLDEIDRRLDAPAGHPLRQDLDDELARHPPPARPARHLATVPAPAR